MSQVRNKRNTQPESKGGPTHQAAGGLFCRSTEEYKNTIGGTVARRLRWKAAIEFSWYWAIRFGSFWNCEVAGTGVGTEVWS